MSPRSSDRPRAGLPAVLAAIARTAARLCEASDALIYLDAWPERAYRGRVERIWPTANRQKGTVEVRISILSPDERLRPEMGVRAVFDPKLDREQELATSGEEPSSTLFAPARALARDKDGAEGVFVLEGETVRFQAVQTGRREGERVAIEAGLEEGARIVLDPSAKLADGDRVLVQE